MRVADGQAQILGHHRRRQRGIGEVAPQIGQHVGRAPGGKFRHRLGRLGHLGQHHRQKPAQGVDRAAPRAGQAVFRIRQADDETVEQAWGQGVVDQQGIVVERRRGGETRGQQVLGHEGGDHPRRPVRPDHRARQAAADDQLARLEGDAFALGAAKDRLALDHRLQQGDRAAGLGPLAQHQGRAAHVGHDDLADTPLHIVSAEASLGANRLEGAVTRQVVARATPVFRSLRPV